MLERSLCYDERAMKKPKRPRDTNQLAKFIADAATGDAALPENQTDSTKNPHAVALGRLGGLKGGKARAKKLSTEKRSEIARSVNQSPHS